MHLQHNNEIDHYRIILAKRLKKLHQVLDISASSFSELMNVSAKEYKSIVNLKDDLPIDSFYLLCDHLKINGDALVNNKIDYSTLHSQFHGKTISVPEKFKVGAYSRRRTIINYLEYIEANCGYDLRYSLLKYLQMTEAAFVNPDKKININCFTEILTFLRKLNFKDNDILRVGGHFLNIHKETAIGKTLSVQNSYRDIYECFFNELINLHEQNCTYFLHKFTDSSCVVDCITNHEVADALKTNKIGSIDVCNYKRGVLMILPLFIGLPIATVGEIKCMHKGDVFCRFEIKYPNNLDKHGLMYN